MRRPVSVGLLLVFALLLGHWYTKRTVQASVKAQPILYYRCPMHPSFRSDTAGVATCCNMTLQPVYAKDAEADADAQAIRVTSQQQQLIGLQYGTVEYGPAARSVRGVARVVVNENKVVRVQTKLEGWVDQINVNSVGTVVKRGQVLLTIYNPKSLLAQQEYVTAMLSSGVDMNSPEYTAAHAVNKIVNGEGAMTAARVQLQMLGFTDMQIETIGKSHQTMVKLPVVAPTAGTVLEYNLQPRQKVTPETLYTIANLSNVWVIADFFEADATTIQPGQTAKLTVALLPGRVFSGTVETILPAIDPGTRSLKVRFAFDNPDELLRPEMFGEIELRVGGGRRRVTVPQEAVLDGGRTQQVFVDLGNGYVEPRQVKTGEHFGDRVEIVRGLKPGERIVTSGNFLLDSETQMRAK